jgi:rubrerythrin
MPPALSDYSNAEKPRAKKAKVSKQRSKRRNISLATLVNAERQALFFYRQSSARVRKQQLGQLFSHQPTAQRTHWDARLHNNNKQHDQTL